MPGEESEESRRTPYALRNAFWRIMGVVIGAVEERLMGPRFRPVSVSEKMEMRGSRGARGVSHFLARQPLHLEATSLLIQLIDTLLCVSNKRVRLPSRATPQRERL